MLVVRLYYKTLFTHIAMYSTHTRQIVNFGHPDQAEYKRSKDDRFKDLPDSDQQQQAAKDMFIHLPTMNDGYTTKLDEQHFGSAYDSGEDEYDSAYSYGFYSLRQNNCADNVLSILSGMGVKQKIIQANTRFLGLVTNSSIRNPFSKTVVQRIRQLRDEIILATIEDTSLHYLKKAKLVVKAEKQRLVDGACNLQKSWGNTLPCYYYSIKEKKHKATILGKLYDDLCKEKNTRITKQKLAMHLVKVAKNNIGKGYYRSKTYDNLLLLAKQVEKYQVQGKGTSKYGKGSMPIN